MVIALGRILKRLNSLAFYLDSDTGIELMWNDLLTVVCLRYIYEASARDALP